MSFMHGSLNISKERKKREKVLKRDRKKEGTKGRMSHFDEIKNDHKGALWRRL